MKKHFTSFSSQWAFMWSIFRPDGKEKYSFDRTDYDIKFAQEIGADNIQIFHLIWGYDGFLPDWLKNGNFSEQELTMIMQEHIKTTVSRYKGRVAAWSVVNEPFGSGDGKAFWSENLGSDTEKSIKWIGTAFKVAHENDPNAKLFLNDVGIEFGGDKSDKVFTLVKTLKEQGYPIDGIGFQMHLSGYNFLSSSQREQKIQQLANQIQRYQDIGIEVRMTELDIAMNGISGTPQEKQGMQFDIYKAIVDIGLKAGVKEFTIFGVKDEQSWLISLYGLKDAEPSLFNNQGIKPSYYAITQALFESIH
jgi:endo-1,4-beta-xylanase